MSNLFVYLDEAYYKARGAIWHRWYRCQSVFYPVKHHMRQDYLIITDNKVNVKL